MIDLKQTGAFIAAVRKEKKLTQKQLGEKLGVTDRAVSKWETGRSFPDVQILQELCRILDIHISELLAGRRLAENQYPKETEKMLKAAISRGQLYGFQIVIYILQLLAVIFFDMPLLTAKRFLPELSPVNLWYWTVCVLLLCCSVYLDKKLPGRCFRVSSVFLEGAAGGMFFASVIIICLLKNGGSEEISAPDKVMAVVIAAIALAVVIGLRAGIAKRQRRAR